MQRMRPRCNRPGGRSSWIKGGALLQREVLTGCRAGRFDVWRQVEASETGMQLTCPKCGARYAVDDRMIPAEGRDVQCSNCTTTWFQPGPRPAPASEATASASDAPPGFAEPPVAPLASAPVFEQQAPDPASSPDLEDVAPDIPLAPRPEIDPAILAILRQEAEREARLRRGEPPEGPAPSQATGAAEPLNDLGQPAVGDQAATLDPASVRSAADDADAADGPVSLPDPDHINASLRDPADRSDREADATDIDTLETVPRRRKATMVGFALAVAVAVVGVGLYAYADVLAAQTPALAPWLVAYADAADVARLWLDGVVKGLMARIMADG